MKILHYIDKFSRYSETFVYDLINSLEVRPEIEQKVLCHKRVNEEERPFENLELVRNKRTWYEKKILRLKRTDLALKQNKFIRKAIDSFNPDLIHGHFGPNGTKIAYLSSESGNKAPTLIHCHGTDILSMPYLDEQYKAQIAELSKNPNVLFISNTKFLKDAMVKIGIPESRIALSNYVVNANYFGKYEDKRTIFPKNGASQCKIISTGRMIEWKGQIYLIDAIDILRKKFNKNVSLTIIGDGSEREKLESRVSKLGLSSNVCFGGVLPHEQVAEELRQHDLYVQPSITDPKTRQCESFGVATLEAVAAGLPVIVSDSGGLPELVGESTKWSRIVKPASSAELAAAIAEHMETYDGESNEAYARTRMEEFSFEKQQHRLLSIYKRMCPEKKL